MSPVKQQKESLASRLSRLIPSTANEPIPFSDAEIASEIEQRELNDKASRQERSLALDSMFPNRITGSLYQEADDLSEQDAFELWLS